jgi:hypothetical protein
VLQIVGIIFLSIFKANLTESSDLEVCTHRFIQNRSCFSSKTEPSDQWYLQIHLSITCRYNWNSVFSLTSNNSTRKKGPRGYVDGVGTWISRLNILLPVTVFSDVYKAIRIRKIASSILH